MLWVTKFLSVRGIISIRVLLKLTKFTVKDLEYPLLLIAVSETSDSFFTASSFKLKSTFLLLVLTPQVFTESTLSQALQPLLTDRCPVSSATLAILLCTMSTRRSLNCTHYCRECFYNGVNSSRKSLPGMLEVHLLFLSGNTFSLANVLELNTQ